MFSQRLAVAALSKYKQRQSVSWSVAEVDLSFNYSAVVVADRCLWHACMHPRRPTPDGLTTSTPLRWAVGCCRCRRRRSVVISMPCVNLSVELLAARPPNATAMNEGDVRLAVYQHLSIVIVIIINSLCIKLHTLLEALPT